MKRLLLKTYTLPVFLFVLRISAPFSRIRLFSAPVQLWMRFLARMVFWASGSPQARDSRELALIWQQLMPRPNSAFPLVEESRKSETSIAAGEIHLHCPLRDSGDPVACYRLMEFDRALIRAAGGHLMVLDSQSNSGLQHCTVLMAMEADQFRGLLPAHRKERTQSPGPTGG